MQGTHGIEYRQHHHAYVGEYRQPHIGSAHRHQQQAQANTLMEVSAGTSDAAVIDLLMAGAMIGEGTSYADLTFTLNLNDAQGLPSEEYGVGFRKGSDLVDAFNTFWAEKVADGTVLELATTYGVQDAVILE